MTDATQPNDGHQTLRSRVRSTESGRSLLEHLTARFRYLDAKGWSEMLALGRLALDGETASGQEILRRGQQIAFTRPAAEPEVPTNLRVLHDAEDLVVVAKPAGLPFHGDGTFVAHTLVHQLAEQLGAPRLRPIQRLDRETSGICVLARSRRLAGALQAASRERRDDGSEKSYLVLVRGRPGFTHHRADDWIGRSQTSGISIRRAVVAAESEGAQSASTRFEVLRSSESASLLSARLGTGRTHQIRVHLEALGHPVLGDKLYGRSDDDFLRFVRHVKDGGEAAFDRPDGCARQMLHAHRLRLQHPESGRWLEFEAEPPPDFEEAMRAHGLQAP